METATSVSGLTWGSKCSSADVLGQFPRDDASTRAKVRLEDIVCAAMRRQEDSVGLCGRVLLQLLIYWLDRSMFGYYLVASVLVLPHVYRLLVA